MTRNGLTPLVPDLDVEPPRPRSEWELFYSEQLPRLWRSLYIFTRSTDIASDAAAEAFARSLVAWSQIREPVAWVFRVGFRLAAGELKEAGRSAQLTTDEPMDPDPDTRLDVLSALAQLPPAQRASVLLSDYYGFGSRDIASMLGCSPSTARVHIARARRSLRQRLAFDA